MLSAVKKHAVKYQQWQSFKSQKRDSKHLVLQKKIDLQHELIQANDKLHYKLQEEDDQKRKQLRDAMNKEKALKQERLMDTCRQSLGKGSPESLHADSKILSQ
ncbi:uncharacterized protein LOC117116462 isoform X2 [Anneissia japonica]|uniref:uncharacterized protein LOC117116462 isoform X2 n=1 Tax=Anneissia japonica TaxID=1529436 RepID=UPI0014258D4B|nr:uncharacterized protein LOC117116462 isoform X2 [Anneissia japonica]